ncbi:MAG: hypothetical protein AB1571_01190 [Nanoarchaeota archaeon]
MPEYEEKEEEKEIKVPEIPEEVKKKLEAIKKKLENFKKKVLKDFSKYVIGIALLPPDKEHKENINVLILINENEIKNISEEAPRLSKGITKIAEEVDKNIKLQIISGSELKEMLFDGKYEILQYIAMSAIMHDSTDMLAAMKISEVHKTMAIRKFEKYVVSYVAAGSLFRGEKSRDIDVYIIIDDTDVKKMSRLELKDKLSAIIHGMGGEAAKITGVDKQFHIQTYILTDFWESVKDAHPVIYTFLRDGVPLYDRGVFMPWKLLLKMGRIRPSPEAIEMQMDVGEKLIQRIRYKMLSVVGEDLYYAILNPAQAALMLYGVAPPTPLETIELLDKIFVQKEKLLEKKYVDILERIRKYYKDIEHGKVKQVSGKDIDNLLKDAEDYLKRIKKLFVQIEERKEKESIVETYESCTAIVKDVLKVNNIPYANAIDAFKKELVDKGKIPERFYRTLKLVEKTKSEKKLSSQELEKVKKEARSFARAMLEYIQRKRGYEIERAKIRFKYGNKFGELILLNDTAFIIDDMDAEEKKISKAKLLSNGSLDNIEESNLKEFEDNLASVSIPSKVFIKEKIFENLRKLFGKDVEILINY